MKTTIEIDNNHVKIWVDDGQPTEIVAGAIMLPKPSTKNLPGKDLVLQKNVEKSPEVRKNVVHAVCIDCGKTFESKGHAKYCRACVIKRQQQGFNRRFSVQETEPKPMLPTGIPERQKVEHGEAKPIERTDAFTDPFDCEMCRNAGTLCMMHEKMAAEGKMPLKHRPWPYKPAGKVHL